jgi:hypothetical protein
LLSFEVEKAVPITSHRKIRRLLPAMFRQANGQKQVIERHKSAESGTSSGQSAALTIAHL